MDYKHLEIYEIVGDKIYEKLINALGGSMVYIPKRNIIKNKNIEKKLIDDYKNGLPIKKIKKKYKLKTTHLYKTLKSGIRKNIPTKQQTGNDGEVYF